MKNFEGKSVVLTGGTGGIGSKVAKKLLKAGKLIRSHLNAGARVIMLVQDPTKVQAALNIKDSRFKEGRHFVTIALNLKEPYQIEKKFRKAIALLDGRIDCLMLCHGAVKNESIFDTNMLEWDEMMNLNVRASF